jgi:hypothetical protein
MRGCYEMHPAFVPHCRKCKGIPFKKNARGFIEYYPICFNMYYVRRMLISFSYSNECVTDRLDSEFVITETA